MSNELSLYAHDNFFGALNFFRTPGYNIRDPLDRPPYPVINPNPNIADIISNMNKSDFGILAFGSAFTMIFSHSAITYLFKDLPVSVGLSEYFLVKRTMLRAMRITVFTFFPILMFMNSQSRLRGNIYNGLQWKTKLNRFKLADSMKNS